MRYPLYRFLRPILTFLMKIFYRVEIINRNNIPCDGRVILAGNHISNLDAVLVLSSTKRTIRFLAKIELMQKFGFIFKRLGIIPVDRKRKNKEALIEAENELKKENIIGIFPEGTTNKKEYVVLPFKYGAVKMASDTNSMIIPFAIVGKYKFLRKKVKIIFGRGYHIQDKNDLTSENIKLMNKIIKLMKENNNAK